MEHRTKTEDDIKRAEQHEALKQTLLRLLEDPQVQQKLVTHYTIGSKRSDPTPTRERRSRSVSKSADVTSEVVAATPARRKQSRTRVSSPKTQK